MKRRFAVSLMIIFALLPVYFLKSAQPVQAANSCPSTQGATGQYGVVADYVDVNPGDTITVSVSAGGGFSIILPDGQFKSGTTSVSATTTSSGQATIIISTGFTAISWSVTCTTPPPTSTPVSSQPACFATDGRLNCQPWETSAVYCLGDGSVRVYVPSMPLWIIAFDASPAEIAKVPKNPAHNTLIKSGKGARLYRLTDGELQVNTPALDSAKGDYVFRFNDCPVP